MSATPAARPASCMHAMPCEGHPSNSTWGIIQACQACMAWHGNGLSQVLLLGCPSTGGVHLGVRSMQQVCTDMQGNCIVVLPWSCSSVVVALQNRQMHHRHELMPHLRSAISL